MIKNTDKKALRDMHERRFWGTVKNLISLCPTDRPVIVKLARSMETECLGDCSQNPKNYYIRLNQSVFDVSKATIYLVLAHEWAHAMSWNESGRDHDGEWGKSLAKCWRVITNEESEVNNGLDRVE